MNEGASRPHLSNAQALVIESGVSAVAAVLGSTLSAPVAVLAAGVAPFIVGAVKVAALPPPPPPAEARGSEADPEAAVEWQTAPQETTSAHHPASGRSRRSLLFAIFGTALLAFAIGVTAASAFSRATDVGEPIILKKDGKRGEPGGRDPAKFQCSDDVDNDGDTRTDEADEDCHDDGNPGNTSSYRRDDDSEAGSSTPACSDGIDNDGDMKEDTDDPGCRSDPEDPGTYDRDDDAEVDSGECVNGVDTDGDGQPDTDCGGDGEGENPTGDTINEDGFTAP